MSQDAAMLHRRGFRVSAYVPRFPGADEFTGTLAASGADTRYFSYPKIIERWRGRHLQLLKSRFWTSPRFRRLKPDLAHVFLSWTNLGIGVAIALAEARVPLMLSVHNAFPELDISSWHRPLVKRAFMGVKSVVAVSQSALDSFSDTYRVYLRPETELVVISNPVDIDRFQPDLMHRERLRAQWGVSPESFVIGSVGRLQDQKQPWLLVDLLGALVERGHDAVLVLVGTGPLLDALKEQVASRKLDERVVFAGFFDAPEQVYPAFDAHVLVSRNEGFGIATAEAMACGVPVLGTDVPGTRDILTGSQAGVLLPSGVRDMVPLVEKVLQSPELRQEMSEAGRREVLERFDRNQIEARLLDVYEKALAS